MVKICRALRKVQFRISKRCFCRGGGRLGKICATETFELPSDWAAALETADLDVLQIDCAKDLPGKLGGQRFLPRFSEPRLCRLTSVLMNEKERKLSYVLIHSDFSQNRSRRVTGEVRRDRRGLVHPRPRGLARARADPAGAPRVRPTGWSPR